MAAEVRREVPFCRSELAERASECTIITNFDDSCNSVTRNRAGYSRRVSPSGRYQTPRRRGGGWRQGDRSIKRERDIDHARRRFPRFVAAKLSRAAFARWQLSRIDRLHVADSLMRCRVFVEIVPAPLTKRPQQFTARRCTRFPSSCVAVVSNRRRGGGLEEGGGGCAGRAKRGWSSERERERGRRERGLCATATTVLYRDVERITAA